MVEATIALLGRFRVVVDGAVIPDAAWPRRSASGLVELLALAPGRCLHREQVLDVRWPDSSPEQARPRLHTAAHYARRALGDPSSVMLHDVVLTLLPQAEVDLDVERFLRPARAAMSSRSAADVDAALAAQGGPLLPEDLFGPWTEADRERLQQVHQDVLRGGRRWNDLLQLEPADEQAHLELMRAHAARGDRRGALRQFERLDRALRQAPERAGHLGPGQRGQRPPRPGRGRRRRLPPPAAGSGGPLRCLRSVPGRPPVPYRSPAARLVPGGPGHPPARRLMPLGPRPVPREWGGPGSGVRQRLRAWPVIGR